MTRPTIGILTWRGEGSRFAEPGYFRRLIQEGSHLGANVFLFSHKDVSLAQRKIRGYVPGANGGWVSKIFPWPDVVIDRCRKGSPEYRELRKKKNLFLYANHTYTNKATATKIFLKEKSLLKWMPDTVDYSPANLRDMLGKYKLLYIKPGNGTGGRSILQLRRAKDGYHLLGRDLSLVRRKAHLKSEAALVTWLNRWVKNQQIRNGNFMVQQGLQLNLVPGRVADTRLLIQKDETGTWSVTGLGVRVGPKDSSTSNLHGGGKAVPFQTFFRERFGEQKTGAILAECHELAHAVVDVIEQHFGSMMEFGLDIGVDVNGRVWLIEVNPKPGRDIFKEMGQTALFRQSIQRPLQYAMHLLDQQREQKAL
ncbi:YheC/YheD family endospore coat-associated protein [Brevibacillus fluminis]|uniref:YheC/YheD family endospore coat-associated protein n=1 Tax=Brevibacillus fluminis TaxID=511487 RepID=UPI003F89E50B